MVDFVDLKELLPSLSQTLDTNGKVAFTVAGNSMLPMLRHHTDSVTLIKPALPLKRYAVVLFVREDGSPVLHRIVNIKNGEYVMRGDNCAYSEKTAPSQIVAELDSFTHKGKTYAASNRMYKLYAMLWCNGLCYFLRKRLLPKAKSAVKKIFKK